LTREVYVFVPRRVAVGTDIYVFGGEDDDEMMQDTVMKYDTMTDAWSTLAPMPHASSHHNASVCNGLV
jgi:N-acetylneuraminic acid mutarotase